MSDDKVIQLLDFDKKKYKYNEAEYISDLVNYIDSTYGQFMLMVFS